MFNRARLKLTVWYLLIITFISLFFSLVIYSLISHEVDRFAQAQRFRIQRQFGNNFFTMPIVDEQLIKETKYRLILNLIVVNGGIILISGALAYFLAEKTLQPIQEMVDEQNRFISDSSHELRTPLTSLKSALEVNLRDKHLTLKDAKTLISESINDVNRLQSLSDELLQLAQYQKPNGHTKFEKIFISKIIEATISKTKPLADKKAIRIHTTLQPLSVFGNFYGLIELFTILLDNAIKYSPPKKTITISTQKTNKTMEISIKDCGIGISNTDLPHIFDRFYRADSARSKETVNGYGLGLSIAKKIADIHHASIIVKSQLGKGSTFSVIFQL